MAWLPDSKHISDFTNALLSNARTGMMSYQCLKGQSCNHRPHLVFQDLMPGTFIDTIVNGDNVLHVAWVCRPALALHSVVELLLRGVHPPLLLAALMLRCLLRAWACQRMRRPQRHKCLLGRQASCMCDAAGPNVAVDMVAERMMQC
jgi:hypothetical protein